MNNSEKKSRRNFIKSASASALAVGAMRNALAGNNRTFFIAAAQQPAPQQKPISPNDRIRFATIGLGGRGTLDTTAALKVPGVELVAVADLYDGRLTRAKEVYNAKSSASSASPSAPTPSVPAASDAATTGTATTSAPTSAAPVALARDIFTTRDYKEILARPDVDAVIIATPDHWHTRIAIEAMDAGKDVYCEKPMIHALEEGRQIIEAQRKTNRVFQVGSQRVSSIVYAKAKELLRSGAIGELNLVEAWWDRNSNIGAWQYTIPPDAAPATLDWERFLGQAPKVAFDPTRFFRWRNYRDYGTGVAGDLFVHLFSGMHYVTNAIGPTRVMTTGGLRFWKDGRDVPDVMLGLYDYPMTAAHPAFNLTLKVDFADGSGENSGFRFIGSEGVMTIGNNSVTISRRPRPAEPSYSIETFPKATQDAFLKDYRAKYPNAKNRLNSTNDETHVAPPLYDDTLDHLTNFFAAVRSRQPVIEDAVFGLRAAGPALLTNRSYFENRIYTWNPEEMRAKSA